MKIYSNLLPCLLLYVLTACVRYYPPCYGVDYNPVRKRLGIVPLDQTWKFKRPVNKDFTLWYNPDPDTIRAAHLSKEVIYLDGRLLSEADSYVNTRIHKTCDGMYKDREYLEVIYYYQPGEYKRNQTEGNGLKTEGWHCIYQRGEGLNDWREDVITKVRADSIIASWGIAD